YNLQTGNKVWLSGPSSGLGYCGASIAYAPTALYFLIAQDCYGFTGHIFLYRIDGSGEQELTAGMESNISHRLYGWSPDGQWVMYALEQNIIPLVLYNIETGRKLFFEINLDGNFYDSGDD